MRPHPSGKPIRHREIKRYTVPRMQEDGYINPRLRRREEVNAIGFMANFTEPSEEEQTYGK